jgi:hypothetical protein
MEMAAKIFFPKPLEITLGWGRFLNGPCQIHRGLRETDLMNKPEVPLSL